MALHATYGTMSTVERLLRKARSRLIRDGSCQTSTTRRPHRAYSQAGAQSGQRHLSQLVLGTRPRTGAPRPEAIVALADWQKARFDNGIACRYGIAGKHWEWGGEPSNSCIMDLRSPAPNQEYPGMRMTTWTPRRALKNPLPNPMSGGSSTGIAQFLRSFP